LGGDETAGYPELSTRERSQVWIGTISPGAKPSGSYQKMLRSDNSLLVGIVQRKGGGDTFDESHGSLYSGGGAGGQA